MPFVFITRQPPVMFALHTSFRQKCLKLRCHWQHSLQNWQCHALCTLGKTSKCWLGLWPIWVVSHLLWCPESWCYMEVLLILVVMWLLGAEWQTGRVVVHGGVAKWSFLRPSCSWGSPHFGLNSGSWIHPNLAPCSLQLCFALHTSFRQKCLKLRCNDFSALADWSPKTDNIMHFARLVKQAGVDLVSDLFGLWAICYGAQSPDATDLMITETLKMFHKIYWMTFTCDYKIVPRKIIHPRTINCDEYPLNVMQGERLMQNTWSSHKDLSQNATSNLMMSRQRFISYHTLLWRK